MSVADWLLMLHVTAAFLLVGGAVTASLCNTLAIRAERPSEAAQLLTLLRRSLPFIFAGSGGTLLFGIWLWHHKGYGIDSWWIWGSLLLWAATNGLGRAGGIRQEKAGKLAGQLAAAGDTMTEELRVLLRDPRGNALSYSAGLATLGILILMIWKPGA